MQLIVFILIAFAFGYWVSKSKYHQPIDDALAQTKNGLVKLVRRAPAESAKQSGAPSVEAGGEK